MTDTTAETDDAATEPPEVTPRENKDGTAPTTEDVGETAEAPKVAFMPILRQRAKESGLDPDTLFEQAQALITNLHADANSEFEEANTNKETARHRLIAHMRALVYVLGGGLIMFGASSEIIDLSNINMGLSNLPVWVLVALVTLMPASIAFFGWHEIGISRASFIAHKQECEAIRIYQKEIVALEHDCRLLFDVEYQQKNRPTADAIVTAYPATMRLFRSYRMTLMVTATAVTVLLVTLALQA